MSPGSTGDMANASKPSSRTSFTGTLTPNDDGLSDQPGSTENEEVPSTSPAAEDSPPQLQQQGWNAWTHSHSVEDGSSSPPWRRLGPPSNAGDAPAHDSGCGCCWSSSGPVVQYISRVWSSTKEACASSLSSARALLSTEEQPPSRYVALIPLSDDRLKPRKTKLIVGTLMLFALMLAIAVFFLVPRGVSIGNIQIHSDSMSWNKTVRTFQLSLNAEIPFNNPNYLPAGLYGRLHVMFFDAETGQAAIPPTQVPARSHDFKVSVSIDASNVPSNYTLTIMEHCLGTLEPRTLVFFLKGHLHASYLYQDQDLTEIDTYFMIDCVLINTLLSQHDTNADAAGLSNTVNATKLGKVDAVMHGTPLLMR